MPGADGIEAARRILGDPAHAAVRVIMLTTFDMDEYVYDALRAGASSPPRCTPPSGSSC
jgi:DNA-binding NarL/FixJ family response regulator